jgi:hypothetical protein
MSDTILSDVNKDLQKAIQIAPWFANVSVVVQDKGDVENQITTALNKLGIGIVIEQADGSIDFQGPGIVSIPLKTVITISENVLINRSPNGSRKRADQVLIRLILLFNPYSGNGQLIRLKSFALINDMGGSLVYQLTGEVSLGLSESTDDNA